MLLQKSFQPNVNNKSANPPPIAEMICVKNASAWVSTFSYLKNLKDLFVCNRGDTILDHGGLPTN